jgi:acyl carrier protein
MSDERIEDQIKQMIVERCALKAQPADIADGDSLYGKWKMESVKILEIVIGLEDLFQIEFSDKEFRRQNFESVGRIAEVVRAKMGGA